MAYTRSEQAILRAFGERVSDARRRLGWTQEELADRTDLDRTYIGGIERGERNVALLNINKLAIALGEDFSGFFPCRAPARRGR